MHHMTSAILHFLCRSLRHSQLMNYWIETSGTQSAYRRHATGSIRSHDTQIVDRIDRPCPPSTEIRCLGNENRVGSRCDVISPVDFGDREKPCRPWRQAHGTGRSPPRNESCAGAPGLAPPAPALPPPLSTAGGVKAAANAGAREWVSWMREMAFDRPRCHCCILVSGNFHVERFPIRTDD